MTSVPVPALVPALAGRDRLAPAPKLSLSRDRVNVLLLEGVHPGAAAGFRAGGYASVVEAPHAADERELARLLRGVHILGIRSRTRLGAEALRDADRLIAVGCYCIGTDQVDLDAAAGLGIPVFNAPHANTRSVAEMVMAEIIALMRKLFDRSAAMHRGIWAKSASGCLEVRGRTLGIVGYGNIGTQLGLMAEALGMRVLFHDIAARLPLGTARPADSLAHLLGAAEMVSLHVPDGPGTVGLVGAAELAQMRAGSYLINASRGRVVDIDALAAALRGGHLAGAALDVFPHEPAGGDERFSSPLQGLPNVILTPHVAASTEEAQARIGQEVTAKLIAYSDIGSTTGATNFPSVALPLRPQGHRYLHVHRNQPGVLAGLAGVFNAHGMNIGAQYLDTVRELAYAVIDAEGPAPPEQVLHALRTLPHTVRARLVLGGGAAAGAASAPT